MNEPPIEDTTPAPEPRDDEAELPEVDYVDPLKRDPDSGDAVPGLDPVVSPIPPE